MEHTCTASKLISYNACYCTYTLYITTQWQACAWLVHNMHSKMNPYKAPVESRSQEENTFVQKQQAVGELNCCHITRSSLIEEDPCNKIKLLSGTTAIELDDPFKRITLYMYTFLSNKSSLVWSTQLKLFLLNTELTIILIHGNNYIPHKVFGIGLDLDM